MSSPSSSSNFMHQPELLRRSSTASAVQIWGQQVNAVSSTSTTVLMNDYQSTSAAAKMPRTLTTGKPFHPEPVHNDSDLMILPEGMPLDELYSEAHTLATDESMAVMTEKDFDTLFDDDVDSIATKTQETDSPPSSTIDQGQKNRLEWHVQFDRIVSFKRRHGHCNISSQSTENHSLGQWIKRQRYHKKLYDQGKPTCMTEERVYLLESIGFIWDSHEVLWDENYRELVLYARKYGHCSVPRNCAKYPRLSTWVKRQRRMYTIGKLSESRLRRLNEIRFVWNAKSGVARSGRPQGGQQLDPSMILQYEMK